MLSLNDNTIFMKILNILKTFINLFLGFYALCFVVAIVGVVMNSLVEDFDLISVSYSDNPLPEQISSAVFLIIVVLLQLASLFYLRKFIYDIHPQNLFSLKQIDWLDKIGKLVIISTIIDVVPGFILRMIFEYKISISFMGETTNLYYNSFYMMIIGLFFVFLSKLFRIAKNLKEDNELTI